MALQIIIVALLLAPFKSEASAPVGNSNFDPLPQYYFGYDVQDALTVDSKSQVESRNGDVVLGQYSLNDPDGTRRIVDYSSDSINGFNAVVRKVPLAVASPVIAAAALSPIVEPVAVRAASTPLVVARRLSVAPDVRSSLSGRGSGPSRAPGAPLPSVELPRSSQLSSSNPSPPPGAIATFGILRSFAAPLPATPVSRSSGQSAPTSALHSSLASSGPTPSSASSPSASVSSLAVSRSSNPTASSPNPSGQLSSIPQFRLASISSPYLSPSLLQPVSSPLESASVNGQARSVNLDAPSPPSAAATRNAPVAPVVARVLDAYAASPAVTYGGFVAPIAYNVW